MKKHNHVTVIERRTAILLGVFVSALVLANLLGSKVTTIFGIVTSVGIFAYPITFLMTDIVEEVRGRKVTRMFILAGVIALILSILLTWIGIVMPPANFYHNNEAYKSVFSSSIRIMVASMIAFVIAQNHDILTFNFLKNRTKGRFLWLRNNISTIISQLIDTTLFTFIAFYMITPEFTVARMISMIIPYWLLKVAFALADTPFVYLGVRWFRKGLPDKKN